MNLPQDPFLVKTAQKISEKVEHCFHKALPVENFLRDFSLVPDIRSGHLSYPCFKLGKVLGKNPNDIAKILEFSWFKTKSSNLKDSSLKDSSFFCDKIQAMGPYLNFFFKPDFFGEQVLKKMIDGSLFKIPKQDHPPFLIEYSQPNTHKELHVGHMRNLCYGHSLTLLFQYFGHPLVSCTFPGDVGTHVAKCLWYLKYHNREPIPKNNRGEWLGSIYSKAHNKMEDEKSTSRGETNNEQLTRILKELEKKQGEFFDLWTETRQWSIELMEEIYGWAGVSFDQWYWESDVDSDSVALVKRLLDEGKLVKNQGALGLSLEEENLGWCLLLKSDGNGLYATKDLELARRKMEKYKPLESFVIVDMRQELHFKQVFTAFGKLGLGDSQKLKHLKYNFVELPDGAMSSRKGNIIPIKQLIVKMKETVRENHLNSYSGQWSQEEIDQTADQIAQGAIKYGMNKIDPNKKIIFDRSEWLKLDGDSGPYIQYTHARICSLLDKVLRTKPKTSLATKPGSSLLDKGNKDPQTNKNYLETGSLFNRDNTETDCTETNWGLLKDPKEEELLVHLSLFNWFVAKSLNSYKTSGLCHYLYTLAKIFNRFYQNCPVGNLEDKKLKKARVLLVMACRETLVQGLALLGIPAPKRM